MSPSWNRDLCPSKEAAAVPLKGDSPLRQHGMARHCMTWDGRPFLSSLLPSLHLTLTLTRFENSVYIHPSLLSKQVQCNVISWGPVWCLFLIIAPHRLAMMDLDRQHGASTSRYRLYTCHSFSCSRVLVPRNFFGATYLSLRLATCLLVRCLTHQSS